MKHGRTSEYLIGILAGIILTVILGKIWIVPHMKVWDILKVILKSQFGFGW